MSVRVQVPPGAQLAKRKFRFFYAHMYDFLCCDVKDAPRGYTAGAKRQILYKACENRSKSSNSIST